MIISVIFLCICWRWRTVYFFVVWILWSQNYNTVAITSIVIIIVIISMALFQLLLPTSSLLSPYFGYCWYNYYDDIIIILVRCSKFGYWINRIGPIILYRHILLTVILRQHLRYYLLTFPTIAIIVYVNNSFFLITFYPNTYYYDFYYYYDYYNCCFDKLCLNSYNGHYCNAVQDGTVPKSFF